MVLPPLGVRIRSCYHRFRPGRGIVSSPPSLPTLQISLHLLQLLAMINFHSGGAHFLHYNSHLIHHSQHLIIFFRTDLLFFKLFKAHLVVYLAHVIPYRADIFLNLGFYLVTRRGRCCLLRNGRGWHQKERNSQTKRWVKVFISHPPYTVFAVIISNFSKRGTAYRAQTQA